MQRERKKKKKTKEKKTQQRGKRARNGGALFRTQRNPFTGFLGSRRELCAFPAERLSTRLKKGESVESAKRESGNREGLKTGALCCARSRRAPSHKTEG